MREDTLPLFRAFARIGLLQSVLVLVGLIALGIGVRAQVRKVYVESLHTHLTDTLEVIYRQMPTEISRDWCGRVAEKTRFRLSVISAGSGEMVCDNAYPLGSLPSVLDRPEVQSAIQSPDHRGQSMRASYFIRDLERLYAAIHSPETGLVLRGGLPLLQLESALHRFDRLFIVAILIAVALFGGILQWTSSKLAFARATRAIEESRRQLQEDLVANVSHEFRTPLTSIRGFASTIRSDARAGRPIEVEFADIIVQDSDRLLQLVNDLLDLSALDVGALRIEIDSVSTRDITEDVLKRLRSVHGKLVDAVQVRCETDTVDSDPDRLMQILINLVGNALVHCPPQTAIEIAWTQEGGATQLTVRDRGPGLESEVRDRLFERFAKGSHKRVGSSGLGLAVVSQLVRAHGGSISVKSAPGEGTAFTMVFPRG